MTEFDKPELLNLETGEDVRPRSFTAAEMVTCESCLRANPPTRPTCLYCGERLTATAPGEAAQTRVDAAAPAASSGLYLVLSIRPNEPVDDSLLERIATRADLKLPELQSALKASRCLPLMQVNTHKEADELVAEFRSSGTETGLITSAELRSASVNRKIRALEFSSDGLTGLVGASAERFFEKWIDLTLLVTGRLQTSNIEDVVRRKRGSQKPVDRWELTNDESIFDLYGRSGTDGWRIMADSFDFSCLGERKGMTAFENFSALIQLLRERAKNLEVNDSYLAARPLLAHIWPLGASMRTGGWRRSGSGQFDVSTVTSIDNENQFTNYSRLLQCLKMRARQGRNPDGQHRQTNS